MGIPYLFYCLSVCGKNHLDIKLRNQLQQFLVAIQPGKGCGILQVLLDGRHIPVLGPRIDGALVQNTGQVVGHVLPGADLNAVV